MARRTVEELQERVRPKLVSEIHLPLLQPVFVDFVITGHPRSGTWYMGALFNSFGYDVGKECLGKNGISCWSLAVRGGDMIYGPPRDIIQYKYFIQVVRDPWAVISSLITLGMMHCSQPLIKGMSKFINIDINEKPLIKAAQTVVEWNKIINDQSPDIVVKAEEASKIIPAWLASIGYNIELKDIPASNYHTQDNSYELAKDQIYLLPDNWIKKLDDHAIFYGYDPPSLYQETGYK